MKTTAAMERKGRENPHTLPGDNPQPACSARKDFSFRPVHTRVCSKPQNRQISLWSGLGDARRRVPSRWLLLDSGITQIKQDIDHSMLSCNSPVPSQNALAAIVETMLSIEQIIRFVQHFRKSECGENPSCHNNENQRILFAVHLLQCKAKHTLAVFTRVESTTPIIFLWEDVGRDC
jgi:hypothetical protein